VKKIEKILAIHYYYFPINSIGTRRNTNILNHFYDLIAPEEILVLSTKNSYIEKDYSLKVKYHAVYVKTLDLFAFGHLKRTFFKKGKNKTTGVPGKKALNKNASTSKFIKFKNTLLGNLILGEGGWLYILSAFFKARKFVNNNTIILSSFSPFSDHIVAYLLKLFHPKVIWVADFRDLYLQEGINNVYAFKLHRHILKIILKKANLVTTVSEGLSVPLKNFAKNVMVLRNGIDLDKILKNNNKRLFKKFSISYTGSLYGLDRNPGPIFSAINKAISRNEIEEKHVLINYAGYDSAMWESLINQYGLSRVSVNHGVITKNKALELQNASLINVVITWCDKNNKGILTGKFFEYIEAANLIIVFIKGEKDVEFEKIIESTNVGAYFYENEEILIEEYIVDKYRQWIRDNYVKADYNLDALEGLTWASQIKNAIITHLDIALPLINFSTS